jgi:hypothetical protein
MVNPEYLRGHSPAILILLIERIMREGNYWRNKGLHVRLGCDHEKAALDNKSIEGYTYTNQET